MLMFCACAQGLSRLTRTVLFTSLYERRLFFCLQRYAEKEKLSWSAEGTEGAAVVLQDLWTQKRGTAVFRGAMSAADRAALMRAVAAAPSHQKHMVDAAITKVRTNHWLAFCLLGIR